MILACTVPARLVENRERFENRAQQPVTIGHYKRVNALKTLILRADVASPAGHEVTRRLCDGGRDERASHKSGPNKNTH
jgi:hypothetical protein